MPVISDEEFEALPYDGQIAALLDVATLLQKRMVHMLQNHSTVNNIEKKVLLEIAVCDIENWRNFLD